MSTKHSKAAEKFLQDSKMAAWHNETLWMVRAKRDKMSKEVPEWEELRNKACELKLYSNSHLEELLQEFEKNATAQRSDCALGKRCGRILCHCVRNTE